MSVSKWLIASVVALAAFATYLFQLPKPTADSGASKAEAVAMVKKAIGYAKTHGELKAYQEISNRFGQFIDRDLYLSVYRMDGLVLAHGGNAKMIGKNLIDLTDVDGRTFVRERLEQAKTKDHFWHEYKFTNPENKSIERKTTYCERYQQTLICGGVYPDS